ncbi:Ditrans,polycis-undecaprenyl-diphosphate synthase ((2E,6E)-farnesyl-diphosphate specific) [Pedobacter sp. Bi27]|jgi:undecaprenyl diphosphate synthase|uniref:isoprenyl transferase n=1 Tax=unclassified Pedobacter TaxID=2628915 RepID=UPI001DF4522D|nr:MULTISPECIES: isoprenyl transferase [unclassified Pedobacter]CAH0313711.1 Ditrans,polycis-undecaprenyl-diphosphate synthase ((2E,6E)-farnesyl-diphosphate specific) [Pedobacter sp. Bi36]CAH0315260.1 Ditrans,polycis-undecaprenyl-diphosphate synthase ((2E,6E)-farnesyl-diphosphate specific) [Pedobacter sp. Bi27]CAH0318252.1 Ditrans,polycis-undecaprenyl-diphosphate synthase ((2E,6E)-farnesyl-diphosphate specific) [Pedobacter sp. Bi126]
MGFKEQIDYSRLPKHIAVIMDGNGRWAKGQGKVRVFGHEQGVLSVKDIVEGCVEVGIEYLTLYAFSTENWNRPKEEVDALMQILISTINKETETLNKNNIKLNAIGNIASLPQECIDDLKEAMEKTAHNEKCTLTLALSYSAKWEILEAAKKIASAVKDNVISLDDINEDLFSSKLTTVNIPDPELMIRTSGEHRISNYLLWQMAYTEFYFTDVLWPDFRREDLFEAIVDYQKRERRFGKISEQLN